jgi:phosphoribosyl-ATP pyrophosphohydrolase
VIESRKPANGGDPEKSYVARLLHKGPDAFLKKIGEEATEVVMAAKDVDHGADKAKIVYEVADLWFHSMIALAHYGLTPPCGGRTGTPRRHQRHRGKGLAQGRCARCRRKAQP